MRYFDMVFWKEIEEQFEQGYDDPNPEFIQDIEEMVARQERRDRCLGCLNFRCTCGEGHAERLNK